ncbi:hypothetical protein MalM25_29750 [Planctomycetes bacterium MalM25]|nr:hypothetical protein MalM25_29750 [Planctomycetes bacterium MalM25]
MNEEPTASPHETSAPAAKPQRLASLDAYRGLTMLLLAFTVPHWGWQERIAEAHEGLRPLMDQFEHAAWRGVTLWDLIQPSFMFMVGVAVPYSYASRKRRGASDAQLWRHAAFRALALVLLGVFLRSLDSERTNWTLEDVTTQIGLGYLPLVWFGTQPKRIQWIGFVSLLAGVWLLFAIWPAADPPTDTAVLHYEGFWSQWNQNTGPGHQLDRWLLNLFPRNEPFTANPEGYNTLNFVPSLATMILGLLAGERLRTGGERGAAFTLGWLLGVGAVLIAIGVLIDSIGVCPMVKKLWTPSFALASGGICLVILGVLYAIIDVAGWRRWAWPAEVVGRNPLAVYVMTWTLAAWLMSNLVTHLGEACFSAFGEAYAPLLGNLAVGSLLLMIAWWMDSRKVYVRL